MTTPISLIELPQSATPAAPAAGPERPDLAAAPPPAARPADSTLVPDDLHLTPPVIPGAEDSAHWESHLRGTFESFAPHGRVQQLLTFRIASLLWSLDRAARCQTGELAHAHATAELEAARLLAADAPPDPRDPVARALPSDPDALRRRLKDARLAADFLPTLLSNADTDPVPEPKANAALRFCADYVAPTETPTHAPPALPSPPPVGHWTPATLRSAIAHFFPNRAMSDHLPQIAAYARATIAAAQHRLAEIESLATRLRTQHAIPHSHTAARALEYESHLSAQLDLALRHLLTLQSSRAA